MRDPCKFFSFSAPGIRIVLGAAPLDALGAGPTNPGPLAPARADELSGAGPNRLWGGFLQFSAPGVHSTDGHQSSDLYSSGISETQPSGFPHLTIRPVRRKSNSAKEAAHVDYGNSLLTGLKVAIISVLLDPASPPTASAIFRPSKSSVHLMGPWGKDRFERFQLKCRQILSSSSGSMPCVKKNPPPNVVGMFALSMCSSRTGSTSVPLSTTIFSAVFGSTQDFEYFQTVEKYEGALHT